VTLFALLLNCFWKEKSHFSSLNAIKKLVFDKSTIVTSQGGGEGVRASVTKWHMGGRGVNRPKKCHVLFEWPLSIDWYTQIHTHIFRNIMDGCRTFVLNDLKISILYEAVKSFLLWNSYVIVMKMSSSITFNRFWIANDAKWGKTSHERIQQNFLKL